MNEAIFGNQTSVPAPESKSCGEDFQEQVESQEAAHSG